MRQKDTNKGNYVLERIDAAGEWKVCHAFYKHIIDEIVVNDVQRRVIEDEKSILIKTNYSKVDELLLYFINEYKFNRNYSWGKTKREITEDQYKEFYILYLLLL